MNFIPDSVLLNNIYIPFATHPEKKMITLKQASTLQDNNGIHSIIDLNLIDNIKPFIDLSKFDLETKDWLWYDLEGFPYRLQYLNSSTIWNLVPIWGISNVSFTDISNIELNLKKSFFDSESPEEIGIAINGQLNPVNIQNPVTYQKFYQGSPLIVTIEGNPIIDITQYASMESPVLTDYNVSANPQFYFNAQQSRIYTNQNLLSYDASSIKIYFYTLPQDVSVQCRLKSNGNGESYVSPIVDYYIVKLNGQSIIGA